MATLIYDLSVVGANTVRSELASLEARFATHAKRVDRAVRGIGTGTTRAARATKDPIFGPGRKEFDASIRAREKAELQSAQRLSRAKDSLDRQRSRALMQQYAAQEREATRARDARASFIRSTFGGGLGAAVRAVGAVGSAGIKAAGLSGSGLAATAINQGLKLDEQTRRLSIAAREKGQAGVAPEELQKQFRQTAIATGYQAEDVASGVAAYVAKTGDIATPLANQRTFATVAQASDASLEDVFSAAADLSKKLDVKSVDDMAQAFAILSTQGKKGAFELKAMASEFPEVFSSAANAGVRGVSGVRDVGALMQNAMDATGNAPEAATAVNAMFRQLAAKAKKMQSGAAFGGRAVQVYEGNDPTKPMRNFSEVALDAISASRGNLGELNEVFDIRGRKALDPMINKYREAYNATKGSTTDKDKAGRAAAAGEFSKYRDVKASFSEVQRDANDAMKSTSVQLQIAMEQLKGAVATQLMPEIARLVPHLAQLVPYVTDVTKALIRMADFLANNPFTGLGLLVSGAIVTEIAKAGLARVIASAVTAAASGNLIGGSVSGVAGLGTLKGGLATAGAAIGVALAADQATSFANENGGWDGVKGFLGIGTKGWGVDGINEAMDRQARQDAGWKPEWKESTKRMQDEAYARGVPVAPGSAAAGVVVPTINNDEINSKLSETAKGLEVFKAALGGLPKPNTSDKPSGVK